MGASIEVLFRSADSEHRVELSLRDVQLLDGKYFLSTGGMDRQLFGLSFIKGLGAPLVDKVLHTFQKDYLAGSLKALLAALYDQRDLIEFDYQYSFPLFGPSRGDGGQSGFRVRGLYGFIRVRPGYCDLTLSEAAPNGRSRIVEMIDMRAIKEIETEDRGILKVHRRKGKEVHWFRILPELIAWCEAQKSPTIEVLHPEDAPRSAIKT